MTLEAAPEGIDLGPLAPRLPEILRTPSGRIELAPDMFVEALEALAARMDSPADNGGLLLIGRRHLRSNNSWMHNIPSLMSGKNRCTLMMHPDTASRLGVEDGAMVRATTETGSVELPLELSADMMPGVVSIPHGWGHNLDGIALETASTHAGVNANILVGATRQDPFSGNAVLNGIPVEVQPVVEEAELALDAERG